MKFRKKPVVIEAFQWTGGSDQLDDPEWIVDAIKKGTAFFVKKLDQPGYNFHIKTLEGVMTVSEGDFVIQGVNLEIYPCKPDIFAKTYEAVE
jgi:hypothetical protein